MTNAPNRLRDPLVGARALARLLDNAITIPGTGIRLGLDPLLGLVPGLGDMAGAAMSGYIVLVGARLGAPKAVIARMLLNIGIDTLVGSVPVLGDLFDVGWKSNARNVALLEQHAQSPATAAKSSRAVVIGTMAALLLLAAGGIALGVLVISAIIHAIR